MTETTALGHKLRRIEHTCEMFCDLDRDRHFDHHGQRIRVSWWDRFLYALDRLEL